MKLYYDLHIHSASSHCADDSMKPLDIAKQAKENGLDAISIVDHVCGKNLRASSKAAKKCDLLFVPAIEATSKEGVHMLCYFDDLEKAVDFSDMIYDSLPDENPKRDSFSVQRIVDEHNNFTGVIEKGLYHFTPFDVWELIGLVEKYNGVIVPAHINRQMHGILCVYDDISQFGFNTVEVQKSLPIDKKHIRKLKTIHNSDAHTIINVAQRENYIEIKEKSAKAIFDYLKY